METRDIAARSPSSPPSRPACHPSLVTVGLAVVVLAISPLAFGKPQPGRTDMSDDDLRRLCGPQSVDIHIVGKDAQGLFVSDGAGSIIHEAGYVLTAEHVTAEGMEQSIFLEDGTKYPFKVVARAGDGGNGAYYDVAVLKFQPDRKLTPVTLGHSGTTTNGQRVMIIGNPGGQRHSVSFGRIDKAICGGNTQFQVVDADVKPGDSGGPIFNARGEQVGHVNVSITNVLHTSRNMRIDNTRAAFEKVFMDERQRTYRFGIKVDCHSDQAKVTSVAPGSAAERAGIKAGDVIVMFGDMRIGTGMDFVLALMGVASASPATVVLERAGTTMKLNVTPQQ